LSRTELRCPEEVRMDKVAAITRARQLFDGVNQQVMEWDPYGLSRAGDIDDEFSHEVWDLLPLLCAARTEDEAIGAVAHVFGRSFSPKEFNDDTCRAFGTRLFHWWLSQE